MKTKSLVKVAIVTLTLNAAVVANSANAGTRVKPPVAGTDMTIAWYQPVLDLFNF